MQIRLADGNMFVATDAELAAGVDYAVDNGVHRLARNGIELVDVFTPDPAKFPHGTPVTVGALIDPEARFQIIGATQDFFDLSAGIPRTHYHQEIPDWDALRAEAREAPAADVPVIGRGKRSRAASEGAKAAVEAARAAVDVADVVIRSLDAEINRLERSNVDKQQTANQLVAQIEQRQREIAAEYERKRRIGIVGVLFGVPAIGAASLIMMQNDDHRLQQLNGDLQSARRQVAEIEQRLGEYRGTKARVMDAVGGLRGAEAEIRVAAEKKSGSRNELVRAGTSFAATSALLASLNLQIGLLTELRDAAERVGVGIDAIIDQLRARAQAADQALEASRGELERLVRIVLADDPNAAATAWIRGRVRDEVRRGLDALLEAQGLTGPARDAVRDALMRAFAGNN